MNCLMTDYLQQKQEINKQTKISIRYCIIIEIIKQTIKFEHFVFPPPTRIE